jgi:hypothetical protein
MKSVWKWIIGIVIALVVVAALVVSGFFVWARFGYMTGIARVVRPGTQMPGYGQIPFNSNNWGEHGVIMRGPGMMGFGRTSIFGGLFGGLIAIGFLALLVMAIIWFARSLRTQSRVGATVMPSAPVTQSATGVEQPSSSVTTQACPKCGEQVQEGWKHCPNCGKKL